MIIINKYIAPINYYLAKENRQRDTNRERYFPIFRVMRHDAAIRVIISLQLLHPRLHIGIPRTIEYASETLSRMLRILLTALPPVLLFKRQTAIFERLRESRDRSTINRGIYIPIRESR